jgi:hypothetical protein
LDLRFLKSAENDDSGWQTLFKDPRDGRLCEQSFRTVAASKRPNQVKWMKLIQWWLVHRVSIDMIITPSVEAAACLRFNIPEWKWEEAKKQFPSLLPKVNQKRLRRMEYVLQTGKLPPDGWTPSDPKNRSTQNVPPYASFWKH